MQIILSLIVIQLSLYIIAIISKKGKLYGLLKPVHIMIYIKKVMTQCVLVYELLYNIEQSKSPITVSYFNNEQILKYYQITDYEDDIKQITVTQFIQPLHIILAILYTICLVFQEIVFLSDSSIKQPSGSINNDGLCNICSECTGQVPTRYTHHSDMYNKCLTYYQFMSYECGNEIAISNQLFYTIFQISSLLINVLSGYIILQKYQKIYRRTILLLNKFNLQTNSLLNIILILKQNSWMQLYRQFQVFKQSLFYTNEFFTQIGLIMQGQTYDSFVSWRENLKQIVRDQRQVIQIEIDDEELSQMLEQYKEALQSIYGDKAKKQILQSIVVEPGSYDYETIQAYGKERKFKQLNGREGLKVISKIRYGYGILGNIKHIINNCQFKLRNVQ